MVRPAWSPAAAACSVAIDRRWIIAARLVVAAVWLFEGLWLKVVVRAPSELAVVASLPLPVPAENMLVAIGLGETLLALAVLSGVFARPLAWLQLVLLVAMNGIGIAFASGAIADPISLVVHNVPFALCVVLSGNER